MPYLCMVSMIMFQINKITNLKPDDPELNKFVNTVLIPGLMKWLHKNESAYNFTSYLHSLGISAEFSSSGSNS
jgi:hypothetical protein